MDRRLILQGVVASLSLPVPAWAQGGPGGPDLARYALGPLPPEFGAAWRTGQSAAGDWRMVADPTAAHGKAIEQASADATDNRFPLAVYEPFAARDVSAMVKFKAMAGRVDRAGGLAVRLADADNYYVVRANALEDNVNFYRVVGGRRQSIKGVAAKVSPASGTPSALRSATPSSGSASTASSSSPPRTIPSSGPARWLCGPRPTASRGSTSSR